MKEKTFWQRDVGIILRWIAVLPAAIAAYLLAGIITATIPEGMLQDAVDCGVRPWLAISLGAAIAPFYRGITAICLASIQLAYIAALIGYVAAKADHYPAGKELEIAWVLIEFAISIGVSVATVIHIRKEEAEQHQKVINDIMRVMNQRTRDNLNSRN